MTTVDLHPYAADLATLDAPDLEHVRGGFVPMTTHELFSVSLDRDHTRAGCRTYAEQYEWCMDRAREALARGEAIAWPIVIPPKRVAA